MSNLPRPVDRATMAQLIQVERYNEITRLQLFTDYLNIAKLGITDIKDLQEIGSSIRQNKEQIEEHLRFCKFLDGVIAAKDGGTAGGPGKGSGGGGPGGE